MTRRYARLMALAMVIPLAAGLTIGRMDAAQDTAQWWEGSQTRAQAVGDTRGKGYSRPELTYLGTYTATAYCSCPKCCGKWSAYNLTASGTTPEEGRTVAADWSVLPAGTSIYIDGLGWRTVEDTGSGVNGQWLDIYMEDHQAALEWGRQQVEVWTRGR